MRNNSTWRTLHNYKETMMPSKNGDGTVTMKMLVWYITNVVAIVSLVVNVFLWVSGNSIRDISKEVRINTEWRIATANELAHINQSLGEIKKYVLNESK